MNQEYSIVNRCLQEVRQSELQLVGKLRLEILLIHIKRLLLDDALLQDLRDTTCLLDSLEDLLDQIRSLCGNDGTDCTVSSCLVSAKQLLAAMDSAFQPPEFVAEPGSSLSGCGRPPAAGGLRTACTTTL